MIGWATVSACTALVKNYSGLIACRFFLGFVEAVGLVTQHKTSAINSVSLAFLPRCSVLAVDLLHTKGTRHTNLAPVYWSGC